MAPITEMLDAEVVVGTLDHHLARIALATVRRAGKPSGASLDSREDALPALSPETVQLLKEEVPIVYHRFV